MYCDEFMSCRRAFISIISSLRADEVCWGRWCVCNLTVNFALQVWVVVGGYWEEIIKLLLYVCSYYFSRHPREIASSYIKIPTDHLNIYIYIYRYSQHEYLYHYFRGNREVGNRHENVSSGFHHHRPGQTCACNYINTSYYTIYQYIILYYFVRLDYIGANACR